jgi:hypothetical protein
MQPMTPRRSPQLEFLAVLLLALAALAACGDDEVETTAGAGHDAAEPDTTDEGEDAFPTEAAREEAKALLGEPESELDADVRVARRGEETFALTEDYVLGRITVELDEDGSGSYAVTSATVELPEGSETFRA